MEDVWPRIRSVQPGSQPEKATDNEDIRSLQLNIENATNKINSK